ncbi:MAG: helix-turn-helix domain containing protein [Clostridia bacterium]|nr:helix-turn-helix domain containing protein [Clostridia bacterium]
MEELHRIKKVINWLIYTEIAESYKQIADILGYTKSSFSQIVNGKVPLSDKFVGKLCSLDENINIVWVQTGEGSMFLYDNPNSEEIRVPRAVWQVIQKQAESLSARDAQIDSLIRLLKEQTDESKKINARQDGGAGSAVAG